MKKWIKIIIGIICLLIFYIVIDLISIYTRNKPIFAIEGGVPNMYVGLFYDTYSCAEYTVPQIKRKGTKFACLEKISSEEVTEKMVMIDDVLYYSTGDISTIDGRCGNMDGIITSTVSSDEVPKINDQSNFGIDFGYQYMYSNDTIEVLIDGEWIVFKRK